MARSVWRGTLSFGLVAIPVSLYPATEAKDVRFHLFDRRGRRVRYRRVVEADLPYDEPEEADVGDSDADADAAADTAALEPARDRARDPEEADAPAETEVAYEDLVRGYEVEPQTYVFLETEEIERARPAPSRVIDLEHFVRLEEIDPIFFEKAYYVAPGRGSEKSYELLLRTLTETGRVGIGRFVLRTKPHLVALRPMEGALALETLFFGDEVRDPVSVVGELGRAAVTKREVDVSKQLVEALATEWEPSRFADEYREELLRMIAERTPERIEEPSEAAVPEARVGELLDALRRSVEEAKVRRKSKGRRAG
jgi:DNA end-binding protein Ku